MWQTRISRCIYQGLNGIQVRQNILYRWLILGSDAIQTLIDRHNPQQAMLSYIGPLTIAARIMPGRISLLGLGGAGVAHALSHCQLEAVEIDAEVIDIAAKYFMTAQLKGLSIIHQDAACFVRQTSVKYQHVLIDLFNANSFPEQCHQPLFFANARNILLPGGIMAINLANMHEQWPLFLRMREQFSHATVCIPVKGTSNLIVLGVNDPSVNPLLNMLEKDSKVGRLIWDSKWGWVAQIDI